MKFRRFAAIVLASSLAVVAAGCSSDGDSKPASSTGQSASTAALAPTTSGSSAAGSTPAPSAGSAAAPSGAPSKLTIALNVDLTSFDVHDQNNGYREGVYNNVFNYLVKRDDSGAIQPDLAESYERVDDVTWHFTLRPGVKFHNGEVLTSNDVKFSLERVAKDDTLLLNDSFKQISEVRVIDDLNLEIVTDGPDPVLLNRLSRMGASILPKGYVDEVGMETFSQHPVGTGPYQFVSMTAGDNVVLKKFPDYFEGDVSDWDEVVFRYIPEASTRVGELLTGGVDIAADIAPADWDRVNSGDGTTLLAADSTTVMSLMVRSADGPTADVRVRQAIDYAIDDGAIVDALFKGTAVPTRTRVTPGITGNDDSLFDTYLYDPDKAKQLLDEAGYGKGVDLTLQTTRGRNPLDSDVAQLIASQLDAVGIHTQVEIMETSRFSDAYNSGTGKELMLNGSSNSMFDASAALRVYHTGEGPSISYSNPEVDDLLDKAAANMNLDERRAQYVQVQQIVANDEPVIPLYLQQYYTGARKDRITFEPRLDRAYIAREIHPVG